MERPSRAGEGGKRATKSRRLHGVRPGRLLVIERGERHEIRNTGRTLPKTLDFHHPPVFDAHGDPIGPGKKR